MDEKELAALKESNPKQYEFIMGLKTKSEESDKIKKELEELKAKGGKKKDEEENDDEDEDDDKDLSAKARKEREEKASKQTETKKLENALKFNLSVQQFVKDHKDILPGEIEGILKQADKETYDSAIEKANGLKSGMIKEFFAVQANLDMLTASHKSQIEDYLKLSQKGKEDKAEAVFENIFEPALETIKKVKKAEEIGKASGGYGTGSKSENAYKEKLMNISKKTHLGEKGA